MTWEELRDWCLSMPGAEETFPFEPGCSVFKAPNGKMFAISVKTSEPLVEDSYDAVVKRAARRRP
jgi:predicted DNA-binding protein (MmcQ/YjbR family)